MANPKKLIEVARKLQRVASMGKKNSSMQTNNHLDSDICSTSVAEKGHFTVYSSEGKRFMVPLAYLQRSIFVELLKMSEDEFSLPSDGPITLPCDAVFMNYILSLLMRGPKDMDWVLLNFVFKHHHSPCSSQLAGFNQVVCSF